MEYDYKICCIKGCEKEADVLGLCTKHYRRNRLYGSPIATKYHSGQFQGQPPEDRFWLQVKKGDGCWLWKGGTDNDGYGMFRGKWDGYLYKRAHRFSFAMHSGKHPDMLHVCHSCDTPRCVRPDHLFLGTAAVNQADKWAKGRGKGVNQGERHGSAKLTEAQAVAILSDPRPYSAIAFEYGVSPLTISSLKNGDSWTFLKGPRIKAPRGRRPSK